MKVKGPDGKEYNFPEGTTREQMIGYFKKNLDPTSVAYSGVSPPEESVERISEITRKAPSSLEGFGRGLVDPIVGGAQLLQRITPEAISEPISRFTGMMGERSKEYQRQREEAGAGGIDVSRMFGNILSPINLAVSAKVPFRALPQAASGAAMGALTPVEEGEPDFWSKKAGQVALGGTLGGAIPLGIQAVKNVASVTTDAFDSAATALGISKGDRLARKRLEEAIKRDQTTPQELLTKVKLANEQGFPQSVIDVAGPNVKNLGRRTIQRSGEDYAKIVAQHAERQKELPERTSEFLKQELIRSDPNAKSYLENINEIEGTLRGIDENFSKNFATRQQPLPTDIRNKFYDLARKDPDFREAYKRAREITEGRKDLDISKPEHGDALLYYTKKGLDSYADSSKKAGYNPEVANRIREKSNLLDDLLRDFSPEYSAQADFMKELNKNKEALELGKSIYSSKLTPEELDLSLQSLTPQQKEFFHSGVREGSMRQLGKNKETMSFVQDVFGTPSSDVRQKFAHSYDPDEIGSMLERLGIYDTMQQTSREIPGLAVTNPVSAILDPQARDIGFLGSTAAHVMRGLPLVPSALKTYAASRVLPATSAATTARSIYGPLKEFETLMKPVTSLGFVRRAGDIASSAAGRLPYTSGVMPVDTYMSDEEIE